MNIYFRIRYLQPGEYDIEEQEGFIRNYIESICSLHEHGIEFLKTKTLNQDVRDIAVTKYKIDEFCNLESLEKRIRQFDVHEEFIIFVTI